MSSIPTSNYPAASELRSADTADVVDQRRETYNPPGFGIKKLSSGTSPTIDIVAIHGFDGHREASWTADNGPLWLRDFLPEAVPIARIWSYGYDAYTENSSSQQTLHGRAQDFLTKLSMSREADRTTRRPIIFIAHSLGGIILKSALIQASMANKRHLLQYKQIHLSTYGILFLGTPHQGTDIVLKFISLCYQPNNILLKHLISHSELLQQQNSDFNAIAADFQMKCFYENLPTSLANGTFEIIVPKSSAVVPGMADVDAIGMHKSHSGMAKFQSIDDDDFKTISLIIQDMVQKAPPAVQSQWTTYDQQSEDTPKGPIYTPKLRPSPRIYWIDATNAETLANGLSIIADEPAAKLHNVEKSAEAVLGWLAQIQKQYLLIFDNADGMDGVVEDYLPQIHQIHVLITSRNSRLRNHVTDFLNVEPMERNQALALFEAAANFDQESNIIAQELSEKIVAKLGFLPLAVDIAGSTISNGLCTVTEYLLMYEKYQPDFFDADNPSMKGAPGYNHTIYSTLNISYNMIEKRAIGSRSDQDALFILKVLGFFHHQNIMEAIFKQAAELPPANTYDGKLQITTSELPHQLLKCDSNGQWLSLPFREAMRVLCDYSLLSRDSAKHRAFSWTMHPVIHMWIRDQALSIDDVPHLCAARALLTGCINMSDITRNGKLFQQELLSHIVTNEAAMHKKKNIYYDDLSMKFGFIYKETNRWSDAVQLEIAVIEAREQILGTEHLHILTLRNNLADTYFKMGKWPDAERLQVQVLETRKQILGTEHEATVISENNLALTYFSMGRWADAERLQVQVLKAFEHTLGTEHPNTQTSRGNLALTYSNMGRWGDAERLYIQALDVLEQILGNEHPNTLTFRINLASVYLQMGRWLDAERLQGLILEAKEKILGTEHPHIMICRNDLAVTHLKMGRWLDAERLQVQVVEAWEELLGTEHPDTLTSKNNLATTYLFMGRWSDAERLYVQVLEAREKRD
ncbi:hypothetical protein BU17DRAFT_99331 [Hysterangium stoloniferum]|nr:hypothetical protein BU17DRAFT_99331 [Hysterangium stoloniferum]